MKIKSADAFKGAELPRKRPFYTSLFFQLGVAIVAGVLIGHSLPSIGSQLRPLGDGFISLIKMIIAPLIFLVIVTGISTVGDVEAVGRLGVKALLYFTCATLFALVFGLLVGNLIQSGAGMNIDPSTLDAGAVEAKTGEAKSASEFILGIIPVSVFGAFSDNNLLQVLFFSVFFGAAIVVVGKERCAPLLGIFDNVLELIFKIMGWVMRVAPLGAFGAMGFIIGQYGIETLGTYAKLILACYAAALLFIGVLFIVAWAFARVPFGAVHQIHPRRVLTGLGYCLNRIGHATNHDQADQCRLLKGYHRPSSSHRLLVQPRRGSHLLVDRLALPRPSIWTCVELRPTASGVGGSCSLPPRAWQAFQVHSSWHYPRPQPRWESSRLPEWHCC